MSQKLFYKTVEKEEKESVKRPLSVKRLAAWTLGGFIALLIIGLLLLQGAQFFGKVSQSWQEIRFAYEKPALVKTIREDYQTKQEKLDQSFLKKDKSSEEKLVDEVVKRLQAQEGNLK